MITTQKALWIVGERLAPSPTRGEGAFALPHKGESNGKILRTKSLFGSRRWSLIPTSMGLNASIKKSQRLTTLARL
jgi:hypothetical protein